MTKITRPAFRLVHRKAREGAIAAVLEAPDGWWVRLSPPTRTLDANARFHAMLGRVEKSGFEHAGRRFDVEDLKTLFVTAWMDETKQPSDVVMGFHNKPVQLRRSTTTFTKEEMAGLMTIVERFAAERGIDLGGEE